MLHNFENAYKTKIESIKNFNWRIKAPVRSRYLFFFLKWWFASFINWLNNTFSSLVLIKKNIQPVRINCHRNESLGKIEIIDNIIKDKSMYFDILWVVNLRSLEDTIWRDTGIPLGLRDRRTILQRIHK